MTDTKAELNVCCAHLRVRYRTVEQGSGCVSGHWECEYCFTEFTPMCHTRPTETGDKIMTDQYRKALEVLHSDPRLVGGKYDYQCGFLDALNSTKQAITEPIINDAGLAEAVTYCQPRDYNNTQHWMIVFEDQDVKPEVYTDENVARKAYDRAQVQWNCSLFATVPLINHAVKGEKVAEVTIKKHLSDDDYAALVASVRKHLELGMDFGGDPMEQIVFLVHRCLVEHGTIKIIDGEK